MARTYDRSLVDTIASKAHVIDDNGLAVELRPLPDDDRPHVLDPRVLAATLPKLASPGVDVAMDDVMAMRKRPIKPTYPIHAGTVTSTGSPPRTRSRRRSTIVQSASSGFQSMQASSDSTLPSSPSPGIPQAVASPTRWSCGWREDSPSSSL